MIPLVEVNVEPLSWQQELARVIRTPEALLQAVGLDVHELTRTTLTGHSLFSIRVPWPYVRRIERGNPNDPLLLQVLPQAAEDENKQGFVLDPLGEQQANLAPGVVQKYASRVLLITTSACAIHCRYCFRRHFPYSSNQVRRNHWRQQLKNWASDTTVNEIILSGGDPLMLTDEHIAQLLTDIEHMDHIRRVRFHTRLPVVIPQRVTSALVKRLARSRLQKIMVLHANHARELDDAVAEACMALQSSGSWVLNQSVLLKGVNDSVQALQLLSERLFEMKVMPYYLHLLDRVQGAAHFEAPHQQALAIYEALQALLPGFLVPKLVREVFGERHKSLVVPVSEQKQPMAEGDENTELLPFRV